MARFGLKTRIHFMPPKFDFFFWGGRIWFFKWGAISTKLQIDTFLRQSVMFQPSSVKFRRVVWLVVEFSKNKCIQFLGYISHICPEVPSSGRICTEFCTAVEISNLITCNKFLAIGLGVSILYELKINTFLWQSQSLLTQVDATAQPVIKQPWERCNLCKHYIWLYMLILLF